MESCHLFNFLFDTKKATSELSKCFAAFSQKVARARNQHENHHKQSSTSSSAPATPIKQLKSRFDKYTSQQNSSQSRKNETGDKNQMQNEIEDNKKITDTILVQDDKYNSQIPQVNQLISKEEYDEDLSLQSRDDTGIYHAKLVQSVSFDSNEGLIIRDPVTCNITQLNQDQEDTLDHAIDSQKNSKSSCDVKINPNSEKSSPFRRVILYAGNDQLEDFTDLTVCSSAEVFNIVNSNQKFEQVEKESIINSTDIGGCADKDDRQQWSIRKGKLCERGRSSSLVRTLVQSFERQSCNPSPSVDFDNVITMSNDDKTLDQNFKPIHLVKPMPPKAPPKSIRARCLTMQLSLDKPTNINKLFMDPSFLNRFFPHLEPLERCKAAQVCQLWRNLLYDEPNYWKGLTIVIDYRQLRREVIINCIVSTLESAKFSRLANKDQGITGENDKISINNNISQRSTGVVSHNDGPSSSSDYVTIDRNSYDLTISSRNSSPSLNELDLEDVWRIQALCNRLANRPFPTTTSSNISSCQQNSSINNSKDEQISQFNSQSSSIPSQISNTLSSSSISSLVSRPASDCLRIEMSKEKLYLSIIRRHINSICLSGASNDDFEELLCKFDSSSIEQVTTIKLRNTTITDEALANFLNHFSHITEFELILCNCITNQIDLSPLKRLQWLTIQDCINISDDFVDSLIPIADKLEGLNLHAYHISDYLPDFLGSNCDMTRLKSLRFPFCRQLTDQSLASISESCPNIEILDVSGTKVSDDGIDKLTNMIPTLRALDLGWCADITDASVDFLALDLNDSLVELVLDRNLHITDRAMKQLSKMKQLKSLHLRWCLSITDSGIENLIDIDSLRYLSIAGLHQVTSRSLVKLTQTKLNVLELTNCQAVTSKLIQFLNSKMPNCNIIY